MTRSRLLLTVVFFVGAAPGGWAFIGADVQVTSQSHSQHSPAVAYSMVHQDYLMIYLWDRSAGGGTTEVWAQRVALDGTPSGDPFFIATQGANFPMALAHSTSNDVYLAVWTDRRNWDTHRSDIRARRIAGAAGGGDGGGEFIGGELSVSVGTDGQQCPAVAYDTEHHVFLVAWQDMRHSTPSMSAQDIYGQRIASSDGSFLLGNFRISPDGSGGTLPAVAYSPAGDHFLVVWSRTPNATSTHMAHRIRHDGFLQGSEINIATRGGLDIGRAAVSYSGSVSQFLVVYYERDALEQPRATGRLVAGVWGGGDGGGELVGGEQVLGTASADSFFSADHITDIARWLVVWNEAGGDFDRRGCWVGGDGVPLLGDFAIAGDPPLMSTFSSVVATHSTFSGDTPRIFLFDDRPLGTYGSIFTRALPELLTGAAACPVLRRDFLQCRTSIFGWNMIGALPDSAHAVGLSIFPEPRFFWGDPLAESDYESPGRAEIIAINGIETAPETLWIQGEVPQYDTATLRVEHSIYAGEISGYGDHARTVDTAGGFLDTWNLNVTTGEHYVINVIPRPGDLDINLAVFEPGTVPATHYIGLEDLSSTRRSYGTNPGRVETVYLVAPVTGYMGLAIWAGVGAGEYRLVVRPPGEPTTEEIVKHLLGLAGFPWPAGSLNGDGIWDAADVVLNVLAGR